MRIRTIKPEFFMDEELATLPAMTRLLFIGLWGMADRRGRLEDRPKRIKAEILPYDDVESDAMLDELHNHGFIVRYASGDRNLIQVINFEKHQRITGKEAEQESVYESPTGETLGKQRGNTGETTETTGREGKGRERKGKEDIGENGRSAVASPTSDEDWLIGLEKTPAYEGINIREQFGKMQQWCLVNRKEPTRRRFINWLNRADRPIKTNGKGVRINPRDAGMCQQPAHARSVEEVMREREAKERERMAEKMASTQRDLI